MSAPDTTSISERRAPVARRWGGAVALAILFLAVVGPIVQEYTAPTAPRYALSAALVERHTIELDDYAGIIFVDRLEFDGHLYSDKAPGQPVWAVPAYWLATAVGAHPALEARERGDLGVWAVTLWSSVLPAVALVLLMVRAARPLGDRAALAGAAAIAFGTLILPYAAQLYGHLLSTALAFGAWQVLRARPPTRWRAGLAGLLAGCAVAVEYQVAIVVLVLGVWLAVRHRRLLVGYALGGVPAALFLGGYQWVLLGSPFSSTYSHKSAHSQATPLVTGLPKPWQALEILFGSRGLFLFTPVVAVGIWGLWRLARRAGSLRDDAIVGLATFAGFFLLQAGWPNPWGGEMPGPRYMIPAMPFLVIGVAEVWRHRRPVVVVTAAVSAFSMLWPLVARHLVPDGGWLVESQMTDARLAGFMPTLFTMAFGALGWIAHAALVIWAARGVERSVRSLPPEAPSQAVRILT